MRSPRFTVLITDLAEQDIRDIAAFIGQRSPEAALRFAARLRAEAQLLSIRPASPAAVPGPRSGSVRRRLVGAYKIYFTIREREVVILRVFHGARRQPRRFPRS